MITPISMVYLIVGLRLWIYPQVISYQSQVDKTISQKKHEIIHFSFHPYQIARKIHLQATRAIKK